MSMEKGIFAVYKPKGITSHDVVEKVRRITGEKRVGHGGTLDPFASGVLVIGVGREYTKQLGNILKGTEKVYRATIRLGATSTTDDPEGKIIEVLHPNIPTQEEITNVLEDLEGEIEQVPPVFSAIKVKGEKAYKLAREGIMPVLKARKVMVEKIELIHYRWPFLEIEAAVSSGTYVRSLARDIGQKLDVGGYVTKLERTRVGIYTIQKALQLPGK